MRAELLAFGLLWSVACQSAPPPRPADALAPVPVRSAAEVQGDFQWQQTVTVEYRGAEPRSFDAVLAKEGEVLKLLGITPLGTVLFQAEAVGTEVSFDNHTGQSLPFDGTHILRDVQRAFFPWVEGPFDEAGVRSARWGDTLVTERQGDGFVAERVFESPDERMVVRFDAPVGEGPSPRVVLDNVRTGYRLEVETYIE